MARGSQPQDDLLMGDDITAAFLSEEEVPVQDAAAQQPAAADNDEWEDEPVAGQLAVDVYETREKLVVKGRVAGVNKSDLDVSISDNTLTVRGTLSAGNEEDVENYFLQQDTIKKIEVL
jgi:HSP20 family molecular chaperone IbpA